jgi:hypothetical protein
MRRTRLITAAVALSVALGGLYLAIPRGISGVIAFESLPAMSRLRAGRLLSNEQHDRLIRVQAQARAWNAGGRQRIDSAFVLIVRQFVKARETGAKTTEQVDFKQAEGLLEDGLARSPVSADGWRWLAVTRLSAKDRPGAASAIRMSLYAGPYERFLAVPRLRLLIQLWDQFPASEREMINRQIRFAWGVSQDGVVSLAAESRNNPWPFRLALAGRPSDLLLFQRKLKKRLAKPAR